jgi:hypothetical protein
MLQLLFPSVEIWPSTIWYWCRSAIYFNRYLIDVVLHRILHRMIYWLLLWTSNIIPNHTFDF